MLAENSGDRKYMKFIIPLIEDPDDSVRWAAINYLINDKANIKNPKAFQKLESRITVESNPIIRNKLVDIVKNNKRNEKNN